MSASPFFSMSSVNIAAFLSSKFSHVDVIPVLEEREIDFILSLDRSLGYTRLIIYIDGVSPSKLWLKQ